MDQVYLGLGSNLGNRNENLEKAIHLLIKENPVTLLKESSIKETEPVDFLDQPNFLNQVIIVETEMKPPELLKTINKSLIECDIRPLKN